VSGVVVSGARWRALWFSFWRGLPFDPPAVDFSPRGTL
jgi:hypothetical protein